MPQCCFSSSPQKRFVLPFTSPKKCVGVESCAMARAREGGMHVTQACAHLNEHRLDGVHRHEMRISPHHALGAQPWLDQAEV
eukprot:1280624-Pleurochrysis_carterae.AAC.1